MRRNVASRLSCLAFVLFIQPAWSQEDKPLEDRLAEMQHLDGFLDLYWDEKQGQLLLEIEGFDEPLLYQSSMPRGVGSNDLSLDRGQLGTTRLVEFIRSGPKVLLIENNLGYRANTNSKAERAAVESSFARSVIWGFELVHESTGSVLVDATGFFLRDSHGISTSLSRAKQGNYAVDTTRSAIFMPRTKAFPDNSEIEAIVTFVGSPNYDENGSLVSSSLASVVPDVSAVTVHLHHSFVRLPDDNYSPLPYDPRAGVIPYPWGNGFIDYGTDIGEPMRVLYGRRHRLEKIDPAAGASKAVEPIVYYVDPGAPEPIRSALVEGASWWNQAFEAAGYQDAFQVKILPEDADPMDVRYNVIQWVHRSTRGWSYGSSVLDPRSGEIIKGHVTLGSLRVRQDYLIAEGLLAPYEQPFQTSEDAYDPMLEMSLARIRQLSAHEVGHTIGMEHNFAASVNDRASVMDYPFPLIRFDEDGELDLSDAYGVGIGEWDKRTVLYAYQDFSEDADESAERQNIMRETLDSGLLYVADSDSRNPGTAHPQGNLWDNGSDAIVELDHLLKVRRHALNRFGENNIRRDRPLATLEEVLVPLYLIHRFQIQAVGKLIGGQYFSYSQRGDSQAASGNVTPEKQNQAIQALLDSISPEQLDLPRSIIDSIPPRPPGHDLTRETFARSSGALFDPLAPASAAVTLTLEVLLNQQRASRMNSFHAANSAYPGFNDLVSELVGHSWKGTRLEGTGGALQQMTGYQVLQGLKSLLSSPGATALVQAQTLATVDQLESWIKGQTGKRLSSDWEVFYNLALRDISGIREDASMPAAVPLQAPPPGSPIGN